jgi:geranylgeranyl reductase family protein
VERADVIVVGAGPAGSIASLVLARAGMNVVMLESRAVPREKVCGDALIPDALELLGRVGLDAEVRADPRAHVLDSVRVFVPSGRAIALRAPFVTIRREHLDAILADAAVRAGARLITGAKVSGPIRDEQGAIAGVRARTEGGADLEARAPVTILATGAASGVLAGFGVVSRTQPSALALRAYWRTPAVDPRELLISYEAPVMPGYGWIFPMANGESNVGVGVFLDGGSPGDNLRELFDRFVAQCPHVKRALIGAEALTEVRGAPLRCGCEGSTPIASGLLVAGEAYGTTYSLTGEGIGKAMESGSLAAETALAAHRAGTFDARFLAAYPRAMTAARFPEKFAQYRAAQGFMKRRFAVNLLAWKAERSADLRHRLESVLREEASPSDILSLGGMIRALVS